MPAFRESRGVIVERVLLTNMDHWSAEFSASEFQAINKSLVQQRTSS